MVRMSQSGGISLSLSTNSELFSPHNILEDVYLGITQQTCREHVQDACTKPDTYSFCLAKQYPTEIQPHHSALVFAPNCTLTRSVGNRQKRTSLHRAQLSHLTQASCSTILVCWAMIKIELMRSYIVLIIWLIGLYFGCACSQQVC